MADPSIKDLAYRGLAATLGGPVDLATMVMRPFGYKVPEQQVVGGSEWIGKKMEDVGLVSTARAPFQEFAASMIVPSPDDLYRMAAFAPALVGSIKGVGKIDDALQATTKPGYLEKAASLGISPRATPVKNYEASIDEIGRLSEPGITYTRSNSGGTGYFHRNGEVLKTITSKDIGYDKVPSNAEDIIGIIKQGADRKYEADLQSFANHKQKAVAAKSRNALIKSESEFLDNFFAQNRDAINNFHKQKDISFIPVDDLIFNQKQAKHIYSSPSYGGKPGSSYKLVIVDGRPAYARQSDHWGEFSARSADDFEKWNNYNWTLPGAERGKRSTGIVFLDR